MKKLGNLWPNLKIIHGYPQSQGLIERGNATLKKKIGRWMETHRRTDWASALGRIVYTMNCEVCRTTKISPYELVFAVSPLKRQSFGERIIQSEEADAEEFVEIENVTDKEVEENEDMLLMSVFLYT